MKATFVVGLKAGSSNGAEADDLGGGAGFVDLCGHGFLPG